MYKRNLLALNHAAADNFNINDDEQFKNLIVWLEDIKIRHYKIDDRSAWRNIKSSQWNDIYKKYLSDLACPITSKKREEELGWLLMFAVRLSFEDNLEKYNASNDKNLDNAPKIVSENPLDNLDMNSPDFINGVNSLAKLLNIEKHPNHLTTLKAISKFVRSRLSPANIQNPESVINKGSIFPFEQADHGVAFGDPVLSKAAKVLRLLYIRDLRQLQTNINECIVGVQTITANPKTDTKLGQVGR